MRKTGTPGQMSDLYVPRIVDGLLDMLLCSFPAISLVGPRSARKTITAARRGGAELPEPTRQMPAAARRRWFVGYVERIITRDVPAVAPRRNPELLRQYLSVLDYEPQVQAGDRGRRHAAVRTERDVQPRLR